MKGDHPKKQNKTKNPQQVLEQFISLVQTEVSRRLYAGWDLKKRKHTESLVKKHPAVSSLLLLMEIIIYKNEHHAALKMTWSWKPRP